MGGWGWWGGGQGGCERNVGGRAGFKLAQNFREKSLLRPEILGRSLLILGRSESVITLITLDGVKDTFWIA